MGMYDERYIIFYSLMDLLMVPEAMLYASERTIRYLGLDMRALFDILIQTFPSEKEMKQGLRKIWFFNTQNTIRTDLT